MASDDGQFVRAETIPSWVAQGARALMPLAIIAVVGTGLVSWSQLAVLADRVERIEDFASRGDRFTAADGRHLEARIDQVEKWRLDHTQFGYEYVGRQSSQLREIFERLNKIEEKLEAK